MICRKRWKRKFENLINEIREDTKTPNKTPNKHNLKLGFPARAKNK